MEDITQKCPQVIAVLSLEQVILYTKLEKEMGRPLSHEEIKSLFGGTSNANIIPSIVSPN